MTNCGVIVAENYSTILIFGSWCRYLPAALCCKACQTACEWGDWSTPLFYAGLSKEVSASGVFLGQGSSSCVKHFHNDEDLYPGGNWRVWLCSFLLCREHMPSSATGCTLTCSCFLRRFFGGLEAAASRSLLGFFKRAFRRGRHGWDFQDFRKGLAGKGSEYGQPFGLRWPLSIHPQGMGVSIKYLKLLQYSFF